MLRKLSLIIALFATFLFSGCDYEFNEITPTYAVPLVNSSLSVYNLLAKADSSKITSGQDGLVTVVYNNKLLQLPADQFLLLTNQNFSADAIYTGATINPFPAGQDISFNGTTDLNFAVSGVAELYRILLDKGTLAVTISSNIKHHITYILTLGDIKLGGSPLVISGTSQYTGGNHSVSRTVPVDNGDVDLSRNGTSFNSFRLQYAISITSTGAAPLSSGDRITFGLNLSNISYNEVDCFLGNQVLPLALDSVELDLFQFTNETQTPSGGTFALTDPRISLKFTNNMTLPLNIDIQKLQLKQRSSGAVQDILLSNFVNPFSIQYPLVPGTPVTTTVLINNGNSNLKDLISPTKKALLFQVDAITNPGGKTVNKITKNGSLDVEAGLELPLTGYGYNWVLGDTVELGVAISEQQNLKTGILRLNLENRFPIDVNMQVYFLDDNKQVVDSLFAVPEEFVKSGILDASGRVIQATKTIKDIPADNTKIRHITSSKYIVMRAVLQTKDAMQGREIKIYDDYFIKIQMGIKAELTYNL